MADTLTNFLPDEELMRRAATLARRHWRLLEQMQSEPVAIRRGTKLARLAHELQQVAFVWPKRSPWWTITKHGRKALTLTEARSIEEDGEEK